MLLGSGHTHRFLREDEITSLVEKALASLDVNGKNVLILIPDGTRTMPMPLFFGLFERFLSGRAAKVDYLVALGTHPPMSDEQLSKLIGRQVKHSRCASSHVFNHAWNDPANFIQIGNIPADEIENLTEGLLRENVPVRLNKRIEEYHLLIICGPVFPHEVVGFSGGNKYLFPGIAGPEIINFTHWLGALMTSFQIIGSANTPVRAVIDRAARLIRQPVACFSLVVMQDGVSGIYFGSAQESWRSAADLSAQKHVIHVNQPYQKIISVMPALYDDLWTAAKGMYKMEPVCVDDGEIIIYAPHLNEVSYTHGKTLDEIGYHCRDFFLKQWHKYEKYPRGVLAHSTHLRGSGSYDEATATEQSRIRVTLATGIPEDRCRRIGLGYLDPAALELEEWMGREDQGILVVPRAGEMLYRLKKITARTEQDVRNIEI